MSTNYTQDMPPKGGFGEINYKAVATKRWISNKKLGLGCLCVIIYGAFYDRNWKRVWYLDQVAEWDAKIALEPFFEAERDRSFLIQLWKNREMEKRIMKDVPGWVPGTFYGIPYFKSLDKNSLLPETQTTFNLHTRDDGPREKDPQIQGLSENL